MRVRIPSPAVRRLVCQLSWCRLRLLFLGLHHAPSPLASLNRDLARLIGELILAE